MNGFIGIFGHEFGEDPELFVDLYATEQDAWHTLAHICFENEDQLDDEKNPAVLSGMVDAYRKADYTKVCALFWTASNNLGFMEVLTVNLDNAKLAPATWSDAQLGFYLPKDHTGES